MKRKLSLPMILGLLLVVAALGIGAFFGIRTVLGISMFLAEKRL